MTKKIVVAVSVALALAIVVACGTSDDDACAKVDSLCKAGSSTTETLDGGGTTTRTISKCQPDDFDKIDNADEVKDCIDDAKDCDGAIACLAKAKKK